jgi:hypothetical protein
MKHTTREQRLRHLDVLHLQMGETTPSSARARRIRQVEVLRLTAGLPAAIPSKEARRGQRMREVELLAIEAGLPIPRWKRGRAVADQIDLEPLVAAFEAARAPGRRQYEAFGLAAEKDGRQVRCKRCGEVVVAFRDGVLIGMTPSTIYVRHAMETGCR